MEQAKENPSWVFDKERCLAEFAERWGFRPDQIELKMDMVLMDTRDNRNPTDVGSAYLFHRETGQFDVPTNGSYHRVEPITEQRRMEILNRVQQTDRHVPHALNGETVEAPLQFDYLPGTEIVVNNTIDSVIDNNGEKWENLDGGWVNRGKA